MEEAERHEVDHTPDPDFDIGVVNDFSLPVVDLESSAVLDAVKSRLDLVDGSPDCSIRRMSPGSDGVAEAMPDGPPVDETNPP